MFKIFGRYNGQTEEIDSFFTLVEAERMLKEYKMAFGSQWYLWIVIP